MPITEDPNDPDLHIIEADGQQKSYLVLSKEERDKGFVRPVRNSYIHLLCGTITTMGQALSETYARNPKYYGATYCCKCQCHFPLVDGSGNRMFKWDNSEDGVGE